MSNRSIEMKTRHMIAVDRKDFEALQARIKVLEDALRPFAKINTADAGYEMGDSREMWIVWDNLKMGSFTLGDLRAAASVLGEG